MLSSSTLPFQTASRLMDYIGGGGNYFFVYDPASGATISWVPNDPTDCQSTMLVKCRESFGLFWECVNVTPQPNLYTNPFKPIISSWIGYVSSNLDVEALAARWDDIEAKLSILKSNRTTFHRAARQPHVVIIKLSDFWMLTDTHRSFATLFLRMIVDYWDGTFDASVVKYPLSNAIKPAIAHWLAGNTRPLYARLTTADSGIGTSGSGPGVIKRFIEAITSEALGKLLARPVSP